MNFLSAAMEILPLGWKVFPVAEGLKVPAIPAKQGGRGVLDATDNEDTIEKWAHAYPSANLGVACGEISGILVVDVDASSGGIASLRELREAGFQLPKTVSARTANGGWHGYYRYHPGPKNSKSLLARGIDIRTTGGYVVAPPSRLLGGLAYRWHRAPLGGDLPALPRWALEKLKPREETPFYREQAGEPGDMAGLVHFLQDAPPGERNAILYWCACRSGGMVARGEVPEGEAMAQLASAAEGLGLARREFEKTIKSGLRMGRRA
jgi:hypothetical protein